ncbi:hypothetical protein BGZ63DRAFT_383260 [Mariannaea sp. PMI_226]|nr:hypothetical protein BGZ63DRAFT_383260 [Mariannaea sp. PMI_226]
MTGVDDFRRRIQKQGDDLIKFIDEQATAISDVVDQTITIDELATSLVLALPWLASPTVSSQASSSYSLQLDEKAVDELYNTIECYEKLNARSTQLQKPNWMRWERDGKELTELNEHAMGFAAQNVSFTVMPGLLGSLTRPPAEVCDIQKMAWELIDGGRPRKGEETWGMVAQGQAKAFTTLLKTLPLEK